MMRTNEITKILVSGENVVVNGDQPFRLSTTYYSKTEHLEDRFPCLVTQVNILNLLTKSQNSLIYCFAIYA